jgi:DNA helicase-2/ATP-dependent DNA helicase PcrA
MQMENALPSEIFSFVMDSTGYVDALKKEGTVEAQARIENLQELSEAILQYEKERGDEASLQGYLEEVALVSDSDEYSDTDEVVNLMTLHVSKGLEFPVVFMVGLEEGLFPTHRAVQSLDPTDIEEERRLAYVGMTRAEKYLHLSYARARKTWGDQQMNPPARFLSEIPESFLKITSSVSRPRFMQRYQQEYGGGSSI